MKMERGEVKKIEMPPSDVQKIQPGVPIHGLFNMKERFGKFFWKNQIILAMETPDN